MRACDISNATIVPFVLSLREPTWSPFTREDRKEIREVREEERDCLRELCGFLHVLCG
jgi:hypothetical protein